MADHNPAEQLARLEDSLLETQRFVAALSVVYNVHNTVSIIATQKSRKVKGLSKQLSIDAGKATEKIKTSTTPLVIADQFQEGCNKTLKDAHLKVITF